VSGDGRAVDRGGPGGDKIGLDGYLSGGPARWLGRLPTWTALLLLAAGTAVGIVVTLVAGQEPGGLLGFFIIVGAIAATLCIRRGKVYLLFPAPALAFFVAAVVTGKVHDAKLGSSTAGLGAGFTQWVAGIFFPAVVATIIVLLVGGVRWLLGRQLISGESPLSAGQPAPGRPRPAPRDRRPGVDSWAADNQPFDNSAPRTSPTGPTPRQGTGPRPGNAPGGARPPRPPRDPRATRDPWGDPRLPDERTQPPAGKPRPRPNGQSQPQPRAPRPSWSPNPNPGPNPPRPPRRQPPEGWTGR
jgi:hypothetical protein